MSKYFIGIDIRFNSLSAALIKSGFKESRIENFNQTVLSDHDQGQNGLGTAISNLITDMETKGAACIASIPVEHFSFRNIRVPFKDKKKIRQILPFEIEPLLPFPVDDLLLDFSLFQSESSANQTELFVAALRKTTLKTYLDALSFAGLEPDIITISGYAYAQMLFRQSNLPEHLMVIDIDPQGTTLFAGSAGRLFFVRHFPLQQSDLSSATQLCSNIRRTLAAFPNIFGTEFLPDEIFLSNQAGDDPQFRQKLGQLLDMPVNPGKWFQNIEVMDSKHIPPSHAFNNAASLGGVLMPGYDHINFLQDDFSPKKAWAVHKKNIIKTTVFACLACIGVLLNMFTDIYYKEKQLSYINQQIPKVLKSSFPEIKKIEAPLQQLELKIRETKKAMAVPGPAGESLLSIDILYHLSRLISEKIDINLTRLVISEGSVVLSGDTDTFNAVDHMKSQLDLSGLFNQVTINSADMEKGGKRVRFKMRIQMKT